MPDLPKTIIIVTSCTGEKQYKPDNQLVKHDFELDKDAFQARQEELVDYCLSAEEMYTGQQHLRLMRGIEALRVHSDYHIDLQIVSAGYGLIAGDTFVAPYECTFQTMNTAEISAWSKQLQLPTQARSLFSQPADLIIVALGKQYLSALGLDNNVNFASPTLFLVGSESVKKLPTHSNVRNAILTPDDAKRFHCGLVGLKGELVGRILHRLATGGNAFWSLLMGDTETLLDVLVEPVLPKISKSISRLDLVDFTIHIPNQWRERSEQKPIRFFIPDWDDMVDPEYDFIADKHSGGSGSWTNQVYAHQMFKQDDEHLPNYDGLLVSRAVAESSQRKKDLIQSYGDIHRYLRVPEAFPVLGDCGAFSYLLQDIPPYNTPDIVDYYTRLNFDFGVSIDHLLFGAADDQGKQARYDLTVQNAEDFLNEHKRVSPRWTPIGALQGLTPQMYANAARDYVNMGYEYLAIGGQVPAQTKDIIDIAVAVRQAIPQDVKLHIFGVARLEALPAFKKIGINSVDSASYLRQAWIRMGQNYIGYDGLYAAIRIPQVEKYIPKEATFEEASRLRALEAHALQTLRALADHSCDPDTCLKAILEYTEAIGKPVANRVIADYRATLANRPWEKCDCAICKDIGVEVVVFRGNNRNRRRGFHNNYAFYHWMQKTLDEDRHFYPWKGIRIDLTNQQEPRFGFQQELPFTFES